MYFGTFFKTFWLFFSIYFGTFFKTFLSLIFFLNPTFVANTFWPSILFFFFFFTFFHDIHYFSTYFDFLKCFLKCFCGNWIVSIALSVLFLSLKNLVWNRAGTNFQQEYSVLFNKYMNASQFETLESWLQSAPIRLKILTIQYLQTILQQVIKYVIQISPDNLHTAVLMYIFLIEARS